MFYSTIGKPIFPTVDASTGFFHENTTSEGEGYRSQNPVYSLIRASMTVLRAIARRYLRKPPSLNFDKISYFVKQYRQ